MKNITVEVIKSFGSYLLEEEKSPATIEKYIRDVTAFSDYLGEKEITKEVVIEYKHRLISAGYAVRSINSMLASLNALFAFMGWTDIKVKTIKLQRQLGASKNSGASDAQSDFSSDVQKFCRHTDVCQEIFVQNHGKDASRWRAELLSVGF